MSIENLKFTKSPQSTPYTRVCGCRNPGSSRTFRKNIYQTAKNTKTPTPDISSSADVIFKIALLEKVP